MVKRSGFIARFIDVCGTSEPAKIQRLLNLPYQTVKNYLEGRLPRTEKLLLIADRTSCSIDWLLTGRGEKFLTPSRAANTPLPADQMEAFVRKVCVEVFNEMSAEPVGPQTSVTLRSHQILSESVDETTPVFSNETASTPDNHGT